jgi:hypothetical protein
MSRTRTSITELQTQRDNAECRLDYFTGLMLQHPSEASEEARQCVRLRDKLATLDKLINAAIDEPHKAAGTHNDPVRYTHNATTPKARKAEAAANIAAWEEDAKTGKVLCLSDLLCSMEAVHVDHIENDEQQRSLEQLGAEALENVDEETRHNIERVAARMVNNKKYKEAGA